MNKKEYWVYIMASFRKCLYVGMTNNLERRVFEHKNKLAPKSFTARYNVNRLVYFEQTDDPLSAIQREKTIKKYVRQWKFNLIETMNPDWKDLSKNWL